MLNRKEIGQLQKKQKARLSNIRSIAEATEKRKRAFSKVSTTASQDQQQQHASTNEEESRKGEKVLNEMLSISQELEEARPAWTKEGYMMRARITPPITDTETLIGKAMTGLLANLLDETIRIRIGSEASLMNAGQLLDQANDAIKTDDFQTVRLLRLEAGNRSDAKAKEAYRRIDNLVDELEIPEQKEVLSIIDETIALQEEARQYWFSLIGGSYIGNSFHQKVYK